MENHISIVGGDSRITHLAKMYAEEGKTVFVYGQNQEKFKSSNNIRFCTSTQDAVQNSEIIISSLPFSKDGINVFAPFSENSIKIDELANELNNKKFFAGSIPESFYEQTLKNNVEIFDLMKQEDLTILNTIATAEGAISDIILNTSYNIHGSKVLILGFGRVSKVLAQKLKNLNADVTCAARKDKDFAWMQALGFGVLNINQFDNNLQNFDIIINTVPQMILDENKLNFVKKEVFILDLASKPGGVDQKKCEQLNLNFKWSLAIPGKVAPTTSAIYIKNTIDKIIKEGENNQ